MENDADGFFLHYIFLLFNRVLDAFSFDLKAKQKCND